MGIASTKVVAFSMHAIMRGDPFVSKGGPSYKLAILYFCMALVLFAVGPGPLSADAQIFGRRE